MSRPREPDSRVHDLLGAALGGAGALLLLSLPWQVDTSGPTPFYKGPLIYPLLVLGLTVLAALPSAWRLVRPPPGASWHLDGAGYPRRPAAVLLLLVGFLAGLVAVGLELSALGFLAASLYAVGQRHPAVLALVPLLATALVVVVFKHLLAVYFPEPLLWQYLAG